MAERPRPSYFPGQPGAAKALLGNPPPQPDEGGPAGRELGAVAQSAGGMGGWAAFVDEAEFVPELTFPTSITTYHHMRSDSQIEALHLGTVSPIREYRWSIDPNKAPAKLVENVASDLGLPIKGHEDDAIKRSASEFNFDAFLDDALLGPLYGFFHFEVVGETREAQEWRMLKLSPRHPRTIMEFQSDTTGTLLGIRQNIAGAEGFTTMPPPIPAHKLIPLVWRPEAGSHVGRSMLRSLYREWLVKDRAMRIAAINLERAGGVPVAYGAQGASDEQLRDLATLARQFKVSEGGGGALPFGSKLELVGGHVPDAISLLKYCDECMARVWALMLLQLGMTQTGNRALGAEFAVYAARAQRAIAKWVLTKVNRFLDRYVEWNDPLADYAPLLSFEQSKPDSMSVADLVSLISAGALIVDPELEEWLRDEYALPARPRNHPAAGELDREEQSTEIENKRNPPPEQQQAKLPSIAQDALANTPTLAKLKTSRARFGITRLHRGVRATVTLPARELRRAPSDNEIRAAVDFRQLDLNHSDVTAGLQEAILGDVLPAQIEAVANQIRYRKDGKPRARFGAGDVGNLAAPAYGQAVIHGHLLEAAEHGAAAAKREAENQGLRNLADVGAPALGARIKDQSVAVADLNANGLTLAAQRHALQLVNRGYTPQQVALELEAHLKGMKHVWERQQARGAVTMAQNQGRIAQMTHHEAVVGDPRHAAAQRLVAEVEGAGGAMERAIEQGMNPEQAKKLVADYEQAQAIVNQGPMHPSTAEEIVKGDLGGVDELAKERAEEILASPVDVVPVYEASEILDERTCDACAAIDGTVFNDLSEAEEAYGGGGYVNCEGGPNCRGTLVAVYPEQDVQSGGGRIGEGDVPYVQPSADEVIEQAAQETAEPMGESRAEFVLQENARSPGRFNEEAVHGAEDALGSRAATVKRRAGFRVEAEKLAPDVTPQPVTAELFHEMLATAMEGMTPNDRGHLTLHPVEAYARKGAKAFLADGGNIGGAVMPDGEIVSLFNVGKIRGGGMQMLEHLKAEGGWHLEAMGQRLRNKYKKHGFRETGFVKWDKQYAPPEWDYRTGGHPNIYSMRLPPSFGPIEPGEQGVFPGVTPPGPRPRPGLDKPPGTGEQFTPELEASYEGKLSTEDVEHLRSNAKEGISESYKGDVGGEGILYKPDRGTGGSAGRDTVDGSIPAERERASYLVAQRMGMDAPSLVVRETNLPEHGRGSVGRLVPESNDLYEAEWDTLSQRDLHDIAVFDYVVGNTDRHAGNAMVVRNRDPKHLDVDGEKAEWRVVPIDHNLTFPQEVGVDDFNRNFNHSLSDEQRKITDEDVAKLRAVLAGRQELIADAKLEERHVQLMEARIARLIDERKIPATREPWPDVPAGAKAAPAGVPAAPVPLAADPELERLERLLQMKQERVDRIERIGPPQRMEQARSELEEAKRRLEEHRAPGTPEAPAQSRQLPGFNEAADRNHWEEEKGRAERRLELMQGILDDADKSAVQMDPAKRATIARRRDEAARDLSRLEADKPPLPMDKLEAEKALLKAHVEPRERVDRALEVVGLDKGEAEQRIALARQRELDAQIKHVEKREGPEWGKLMIAAQQGDEPYVNEVIGAFKKQASAEGRQWTGAVWEAREANVMDVLNRKLGRPTVGSAEALSQRVNRRMFNEEQQLAPHERLARRDAERVEREQMERAGEVRRSLMPEKLRLLPQAALEAIRKNLIGEGRERDVAKVEKVLEEKVPGWKPMEQEVVLGDADAVRELEPGKWLDRGPWRIGRAAPKQAQPEGEWWARKGAGGGAKWFDSPEAAVEYARRGEPAPGGFPGVQTMWENERKRLVRLREAAQDEGHLNAAENLDRRLREHLANAPGERGAIAPMDLNRAREVLREAREPEPKVSVSEIARAKEIVEPGVPQEPVAIPERRKWEAEREVLRDAQHAAEVDAERGVGPPQRRNERLNRAREAFERHLENEPRPGEPLTPEPREAPKLVSFGPPAAIREAQAIVANPLHYGASERLPNQVLLDEWDRWRGMDGEQLRQERRALLSQPEAAVVDRLKVKALDEAIRALPPPKMSEDVAQRILDDAAKPPGEQFFNKSAIERAQAFFEEHGKRPPQAVPQPRVTGAQPGTPGEWRWAKAVVARPEGAAAEDVEAAKHLLGRPSAELDEIRKALGIGQGEAYGANPPPDWKALALAARKLAPIVESIEIREARAALGESLGSIAERSHNQVLVSDFGKWQTMGEPALVEDRERRRAEGVRIPVLLERAIEQREVERRHRELLEHLAAEELREQQREKPRV